MMKRFFLFMLPLFFLQTAARAEERSLRDRMALAAKAIDNLPKDGKLRAPRLEHRRLRVLVDSIPGLTILGYVDGGFAIVANDDAVPVPVLGVAGGRFNQGSLPDGLVWWLSAMSETLSRGVTPEADALTPVALGFPAQKTPFMRALWDQEGPYNQFCPLKNEEKTLTGCVATAMAQVMYHYRYPARGTGRVTSNSTGISLRLEDEQPYAWDQMKDNYQGTYTAEQGQAVARLMLHAGLSVNMQYDISSKGGSGAYTFDVSTALRNNFGYSSNVAYHDRVLFSRRQWQCLLLEELSNGRPVIYGASDHDFGGHCFVMHGYDAQGRVFVNWGWSGSQDGYYSVSLLNPRNLQFSGGQSMITGIALPGDALRERRPEMRIAGGDLEFEKIESGSRVSVKVTMGEGAYVYNYSDLPFAGQLALALADSTGRISYGKVWRDCSTSPVEHGYGVTSSYSAFISRVDTLPDGLYRIYPVARIAERMPYYPLYVEENRSCMCVISKRDGVLKFTLSTDVVNGLSPVREQGVNTTQLWYDLRGRRVGRPVAPGVYIHGGRKVVVR